MKQRSLSAGAVIYRKRGTQLEFLLLRSFKYWDFPKGHVEANEDPWDGALREVREETGIHNLLNPMEKVFIETAPYGKGKVARYYILEASSDAEVILEANPLTGIIEHHEFRWLKASEVEKLLVPRVLAVFQWAINLIPD